MIRGAIYVTVFVGLPLLAFGTATLRAGERHGMDVGSCARCACCRGGGWVRPFGLLVWS